MRQICKKTWDQNTQMKKVNCLKTLTANIPKNLIWTELKQNKSFPILFNV
jgi:hypothetical protein